MKSHRSWLALAIAALGAGCLAEPATNGASLLCTEDTQCVERFGEGFRCLSGGCVVNEPPAVTGFAIGDGEPTGFGPFYTRESSNVSLTVAGSDSDGDEISFRWQEVSRPEAEASDRMPMDGERITIESAASGAPLALGSYVYRVIPSDGRVDGEPREVVLTVESADDVVYVSRLTGEDGDGCGSIVRPCATLGRGLRESGGGAVYLASSASPYQYCLGELSSAGADGADSSQVRGCFDPESWEPVPSRRGQCEIRCDEPFVVSVPTGETLAFAHVLTSSSSLRDVTLTARTTGLPGEVTDSITLLVDGDADAVTEGVIRVRDVDVRAAGCGDTCSAVGVLLDDARVELEGINISAESGDFATVSSFIGLAAENSGGTIRGDLEGEYPVPEGRAERQVLLEGRRGRINLNLPALELAIGMSLVDFSGTVSGLAITGGLGLNLVGASVIGGEVTLTDTVIDVLGFGSRFLIGAQVTDCDAESGECDEPPPPDAWARFAARNNSIFLSGTTSGDLIAPCAGVGLDVRSRNPAQTLSANTMVLGGQLTLSLGASFLVLPSSEPGEERGVLSDNEIRVSDGNADLFCEFINQALNVPVTAGLIGAQLAGSTLLDAHDNFILIGPQTTAADPYQAESRLISTGFRVADALEHSTEPMNVARNEVRMGEGATQSLGLIADSSRIEIVNNLLYGGDAPRSAGLSIRVQDDDADEFVGDRAPLPVVRHNTIHGGGLAGRSASSRGLAIEVVGEGEAAATLTNVGTFVGNLIDAGAGLGRRLIIDNALRDGGALRPDESTASARNYGQLTPGAASRPVAGTVNLANLEGTVRRSLIWRVFTAEGEALSVRGTTSSSFDIVGDTPVAIRAPLYSIVELGGGNSVVVAANSEVIGISEISSGTTETIPNFDVRPIVGHTLGSLVDLAARGDGQALQIFLLADTAEGRQLFLANDSGSEAALTPVFLSDEDLEKLLGGNAGNGTNAGHGTIDAIFATREQRIFFWFVPDDLDSAPVLGELDRNNTVLAAYVLSGIDTPDELLVIDDGVFTDNTFDLVVRADGRVIVFEEVEPNAGVLCAPGVSSPSCTINGAELDSPCGAAEPTAVTTIEGDLASLRYVVGCSDGVIQVFDQANSLETSTSPTELGAAPGRVRGFVSDPILTHSLFLALYADSGALVAYALEPGVTGPEIHTSAVLSDFSNVAARNPSTGALLSTLGTATSIVEPDTQCELTAPADLRDLRLRGGSCVNASGLDLMPLSVDVDGQSRDCAPDVGATELTSSPGSCP